VARPSKLSRFRQDRTSTLRRTVIRDSRGALVTLANGDLRTVGNLSRDWSQAFVDIAVPLDEPLERALQALEVASAALRSDPSWSQAIVDGPRVLGVQSYGPMGSTFRIQVRTARPVRTKSHASCAAASKWSFSAKTFRYPRPTTWSALQLPRAEEKHRRRSARVRKEEQQMPQLSYDEVN